MKAPHVFGIFVRSLGVCLLLFGLWHLVFALSYSYGLLHKPRYDEYDGDFDPFMRHLIGISSFLVGGVMMRYARSVVRFCYRKGEYDTDY